MTSKTRSFRISPAMIVASVALLLALTGSAIAAGVAKNSVRSAQIVDATVRTVDLRDNAVNSAKIAPDAVGAEEIAENAVSSPEVAQDSLTAGDLAPASVTSSEVADQSLTANDLGPDSVGSSEIATDAVNSSELAANAVNASELGTVTIRTSAPQAIAAGANGGVSVDCGPGEQVLGGGGQPANFGVEMTSSRPRATAGSTRQKTTTARHPPSARSPSAWSANPVDGPISRHIGVFSAHQQKEASKAPRDRVDSRGAFAWRGPAPLETSCS